MVFDVVASDMKNMPHPSNLEMYGVCRYMILKYQFFFSMVQRPNIQRAVICGPGANKVQRFFKANFDYLRLANFCSSFVSFLKLLVTRLRYFEACHRQDVKIHPTQVVIKEWLKVSMAKIHVAFVGRVEIAIESNVSHNKSIISDDII